MEVLYLHGFASGPQSTKARFFRDRFSQCGIKIQIPDLNQPDFRSLTLTSQMKIVRKCLANIEDSQLVLMGSSMGGLLATMAATSGAASPDRMILLAPGFNLFVRWTDFLHAEKLQEWKAAGFAHFYHYALGADAQLDYGFIEDATTHITGNFTVKVPSLVFHGRNDTTVPVQESINFRDQNAGFVTLEILDDGHELIQSLDSIWESTSKFLHISSANRS